ncbi:MAG: antibiotic biosynthesis monooxygenase [Acidobacteria bacterium]|nr:antibiotic biosynthesis monooxygenase [Acidobacteriota bacterium]
MNRISVLCQLMVVSVLIGAPVGAIAQTTEQPIVRIAELEIDPAQMPVYQEALKEEIATSIRIEPGVLTLYAVSVKGHPDQVRIFETYKDQAAYEKHIQSPHFKKYKAATQNMVKSLKLIETEPIMLGRK